MIGPGVGVRIGTTPWGRYQWGAPVQDRPERVEDNDMYPGSRGGAEAWRNDHVLSNRFGPLHW